MADTEMSWWQLILSALTGSAITFVGFRTKLALMDRRIETRKSEITTLRQDLSKHMLEREQAVDERMAALERAVDTRLSRIERKQTLMLQIAADIAKKIGVESRFSDVIVRFLAEEADQPRES